MWFSVLTSLDCFVDGHVQLKCRTQMRIHPVLRSVGLIRWRPRKVWLHFGYAGMDTMKGITGVRLK